MYVKIVNNNRARKSKSKESSCINKIIMQVNLRFYSFELRLKSTTIPKYSFKKNRQNKN